MNSYKAPNLIIIPKRKVYRRRGRGHSTMNSSTHTHTHTHSLSPPLLLPLPLPPLPPIHTYIYHSVRKRRLLGREKCVFRANLKAIVELE